MNITTIIPIYNEEKGIVQFQESISCLKGISEIIFVDGGSTDRTMEWLSPEFRLLHSKKGRANQMNYGAEESSGEVLFFLHCDSEIPKDAMEEIRAVMAKYDVGCFGIAFHSNNIWMKFCQVISNHRIKDRKVVFGDQGLFIKKQVFMECGGFPDIPIMEDYQLSLTLKERGVKIGLTTKRIYTSDRRFRQGGRLKVMWKMNRLRAMYRKGVEIEKIARLYKDIR